MKNKAKYQYTDIQTSSFIEQMEQMATLYIYEQDYLEGWLENKIAILGPTE